MLPDLPGLKNDLAEVQRTYMIQVKDAHLGPFSDCPVHPCFEGHRHSILRATGDGEVKEFERIDDITESPYPASAGSWNVRYDGVALR